MNPSVLLLLLIMNNLLLDKSGSLVEQHIEYLLRPFLTFVEVFAESDAVLSATGLVLTLLGYTRDKSMSNGDNCL